MHTIKGSSAMMEFDSLATVAHRIEDMFFIIRAGQTGEKIRYDSNFQSFIQQLRRSQGAGQALAKLMLPSAAKG